MQSFKESLWANIHKKRKEGRPMRKPGSKGAPTDQDFKSARGESAEVNEISPEKKKAYKSKAERDLPQRTKYANNYQNAAKADPSNADYKKRGDAHRRKEKNRMKGIASVTEKNCGCGKTPCETYGENYSEGFMDTMKQLVPGARGKPQKPQQGKKTAMEMQFPYARLSVHRMIVALRKARGTAMKGKAQGKDRRENERSLGFILAHVEDIARNRHTEQPNSGRQIHDEGNIDDATQQYFMDKIRQNDWTKADQEILNAMVGNGTDDNTKGGAYHARSLAHDIALSVKYAKKDAGIKESVNEGFMDTMKQLVPGAKGKPAKKLNAKKLNAEQVKISKQIDKKLKLIDGLIQKVRPLGGQIGGLVRFSKLPIEKMTPKDLYRVLNDWYDSIEDELDNGDDSAVLSKKYGRSVEDLHERLEELALKIKDYMYASGYDVPHGGAKFQYRWLNKVDFSASKRTDAKWLKMNESVDEGFMDTFLGRNMKKGNVDKKRVKKSKNSEQVKLSTEIDRKLRLIDDLMQKVRPLGGKLGKLMAFRKLPIEKMTPKGMYLALNDWWSSIEADLDDDSEDDNEKYAQSAEKLYDLWEEVGFKLSDYMWASGYNIKGIGQMAKIGFPAKKRTDPEWLKMNESVDEGFMDAILGKNMKKRAEGNAEQTKIATDINRKLTLIDGLMKKVKPLGGKMTRLTSFRKTPIKKMTPKDLYRALNDWYLSIDDYLNDNPEVDKRHGPTVVKLHSVWEEVADKVQDYMWASGYNVKRGAQSKGGNIIADVIKPGGPVMVQTKKLKVDGKLVDIDYNVPKRTDAKWLKMNESRVKNVVRGMGVDPDLVMRGMGKGPHAAKDKARAAKEPKKTLKSRAKNVARGMGVDPDNVMRGMGFKEASELDENKAGRPVYYSVDLNHQILKVHDSKEAGMKYKVGGDGPDGHFLVKTISKAQGKKQVGRFVGRLVSRHLDKQPFPHDDGPHYSVHKESVELDESVYDKKLAQAWKKVKSLPNVRGISNSGQNHAKKLSSLLKGSPDKLTFEKLELALGTYETHAYKAAEDKTNPHGKEDLAKLQEFCDSVDEVIGAMKNLHQSKLKESLEENYMACKDCGDEFAKPTTDCENDCYDENGSHWESVDEALSMQQRLARGRSARRNKQKMARGRERAKRKVATKDVLMKRARKAARKALYKKLTKNATDLSPARKKELETKLQKPQMQKVVHRLAKKLVPKIKKAETQRRSGSK